MSQERNLAIAYNIRKKNSQSKAPSGLITEKPDSLKEPKASIFIPKKIVSAIMAKQKPQEPDPLDSLEDEIFDDESDDFLSVEDDDTEDPKLRSLRKVMTAKQD